MHSGFRSKNNPECKVQVAYIYFLKNCLSSEWSEAQLPLSGYSVFRIFWFEIYPPIFCWLFWQKSENILSQPTKFWKSADSEFFQNNEIFCQNNKIFCQNTKFFSHGQNFFPTVEFFSHGLIFGFGLYFIYFITNAFFKCRSIWQVPKKNFHPDETS